MHGRLFAPDDDRAGAAGKAILSHGTWMRRFGGDAEHDRARDCPERPTVSRSSAVAPEGFSLPRNVLPTLGGAEDAEVLLSLPLGADAAAIRTREDYNIVGKLNVA